MTGWEIERSQGNPCEVMHLRTSRIWTPICPGTRKGRPKIMEVELELLAHHPASRLSAPSNATSSEEAGRANHIRLVAGQPGPESSSVIAFLRGWEHYATAHSRLRRRMLGTASEFRLMGQRKCISFVKG